MANFTPQQIEDFLQEFFDVVGTRQYTGARYVPIFGRAGSDTVEWDDLEPYEPLTVVMHRGVSYVSRRYVPRGIDITDNAYWAETYRFNAQVEQYRQQVLEFQDQIDARAPLPLQQGVPQYGEEGQVLSTNGDGTTTWANPVTPDAELTGEAVSDWLDAHPEATTTVQDGAVTTAKLADGAVTSDKLAGASVTEAKVADGAVTSGKVADGAVGDPKLTPEGAIHALMSLYEGVCDSVPVTLEQGSLSTNTGGPSPLTNRLRSDDFIPLSQGTILFLSTRYQFELFWYGLAQNFISSTTWALGNGTRPSDLAPTNARYLKVVLRNAATPSLDLYPSDIGEGEFGIFVPTVETDWVADGAITDPKVAYLTLSDGRLDPTGVLHATQSAFALTGTEQSVTLEQGTLNSNNGKPNTIDSRVRSADQLVYDPSLLVFVSTRFDIDLFFYAENGTYLEHSGWTRFNGLTVGDYAPDGTVFLKLCLRYHDSPNGEIVPSDVGGDEFGVYLPTSVSPVANSLLPMVTSDMFPPMEAQWEQGTLASNDGRPYAIDTRIRTADFIPASTLAVVSSATGAKANVFSYDSEMGFLGSTGFVQGTIDVQSVLEDGAALAKVAVAFVGNSVISPTDAESNVTLRTGELPALRSAIDAEPFSRKVRVCEITKTEAVRGGNTGCCFVSYSGTVEFWTFMVSPDDHSETANWYRTEFDPDTLTFGTLTKLTHNLGHVNSCSYNTVTDTFVCGNGSGDYTLPGEIIIVEGAFSKTALTYNEALRIPFLTYGAKVNAIWGDSNYGQNDVLFVVTNDGYDIYRVLLGRDDNILDGGTYQKPNGYNGTYKILEHWEYGNTKAYYPHVVQGFTFIGNALYYGYGHYTNALPIHKVKLCDDVETTEVDYEEYEADGTLVTKSIAGLTSYGRNLFVTYANMTYIVDSENV